MVKHTQSIFEFSCGGFFGGYWELEILKSSEGHFATYSNSHYPETECRDFHVTDAQMEKLKRQLDISGVEGWYCHYFSPILDGTQWEVRALGESYGGSNAFPKGFDALAAFLAEEFGCKELMVEGGYESAFPDEMDGIDHVAAYAATCLLVNVEELRRKHRSGLMDEDEVEEGEAETEESARELLHDLYVLAEENPRYKDYRSILESHGIPLDVRRIAEQDMDGADDLLIIASMIAISRSDRFDGYSDNFGKCARNGTFALWLEML